MCWDEGITEGMEVESGSEWLWFARRTEGTESHRECHASLTLFCGVCQPLVRSCLTIKFVFRPLVNGKWVVDREACRGPTYRFSEFPQGHSREFRLHTCCWSIGIVYNGMSCVAWNILSGRVVTIFRCG